MTEAQTSPPAAAQRRLPRLQGSVSAAWPRQILVVAQILVSALGLVAWAGTAVAQDAFVQIELGSHAGAARRIAVDAVRGLVVTGSDDKTARVWSLQGGELRRVLRPPVGAGEEGRVYGVAVHPQRGWVAVGGTSPVGRAAGPAIQIYDAETGESVRRIAAGSGDVKRLLWSPDGTALIAGYAGTPVVRAFDLEGREVFADGFSAGVYAVAVAPGVLAAAGLDGSLRLYADAGVGASPRFVERWRLGVGANPVSLAFSPAGDALAIGYFVPGKAPDVVDLRTRRLTSGVSPPSLGNGTLMSVAWTADGRRVIAGGDYGFSGRNTRFVVTKPGTWSSEEIESGASSTITDLQSLPGGQFAFASADGSWGVLDLASRRSRIERAELPDLDGAANLLASTDGRQLSWTLNAGRNPVSFDLDRRVASNGRVGAVQAALRRRGLFDAPSDWENHRNPHVNGARIALAADEIARAAAVFGDGPDAVLGTSRALWRIGPGGSTVWRRTTHTEVRAVHIVAGGRIVVAAMLDGTLRLHRARDGVELLALLVLRDRRWVLWTQDGYFDASVGADRLVGWVVNRDNGGTADYFPVASFRERFHQPRYIDLLLETLDPEQAARRHREEIAQSSEGAALAILPTLPGASAAHEPMVSPAAAQAWPSLAALLVPQALPPSLQSPWRTIEFIARTPEAEVKVDVPVAVRRSSRAGALSFDVRIDGRRSEAIAATLEPASDGLERGVIQLLIPASASAVQLVARDGNGQSEAWVLAVRAQAPPPVLATLQSTLSPPLSGVAPLPSGAGVLPAVPAVAALPPPPALVASVHPAPPAPPAAGRLFVLAVGVSDYQRPEYRLRLAAKDAADFAGAIRAQQSKLYREVVVRQLLDRDATRANVLASLLWLSKQGAKGDTYMVFLAGHGANGPAGTYYFLTADARHENLSASALSDREIRSALRQIPGRTLMFIDTCHAGNALGATTKRNTEAARFVNDMSDNGVVVFAASSGRQESLESDAWGNGAFTAALIEGLAGKADPLRLGRVTYKGLDYYVSESVQRMTKGLQTPVSLSPLGVPDFELARL